MHCYSIGCKASAGADESQGAAAAAPLTDEDLKVQRVASVTTSSEQDVTSSSGDVFQVEKSEQTVKSTWQTLYAIKIAIVRVQ